MNKDSYEDIIDLPHYEPKNHPRMTLESRAAQFAPFSALSGYGDAIKETSKLTDERIEIDEGLKLHLNNKLQTLINNNSIKATFTYFVKDKNKDGGKYITATGSIKKIDIINEYIILNDNTKIPINDIVNITSNLI